MQKLEGKKHSIHANSISTLVLSQAKYKKNYTLVLCFPESFESSDYVFTVSDTSVRNYTKDI